MNLLNQDALLTLMESVAEDAAHRALQKFKQEQSPDRKEEVEDLLTLKEAATLLKVSPSTLYKLRNTGQVKCSMVGSSPRISMDEIRRYIASQQV